jgi:nicotinate phosphoribosyltransferase
MAYKLVEYAGQPRTKQDGRMKQDTVGRHDQKLPGEPLLQPMMRGGQRLGTRHRTLEEDREHARMESHERLPERLRQLEPAPHASVAISNTLRSELESLRRASGSFLPS